MSDRRGKEIKFVKGKYAGYRGWIDNDGQATAKSVPVIVHKFPNAKGVLKDRSAMVRKSSILEVKEPSSYAEAVFMQNLKVSVMMDKLCEHLAMCEVSPDDQNLVKIFSERLKKVVEKQAEKGDDALWYQIDYQEHNEA